MKQRMLWIARPVFLTLGIIALAQGETPDVEMRGERGDEACQSDGFHEAMGVNL